MNFITNYNNDTILNVNSIDNTRVLLILSY